MFRCIEDAVSVRMLRDKFDYDAETGILTHKMRVGVTRWEKAFNTRFGGKAAGNRPNTSGHLQVSFTTDHGEHYLILVHRIAWAMYTGEWPASDLDHRDTDKSNNRFVNLRPCDGSGNRMNTSARADNKVGFKGVCHTSRNRERFMAQIQVRGEKIHLGEFSDPKDAARAYDTAALEHHGEFARTNASMGLL